MSDQHQHSTKFSQVFQAVKGTAVNQACQERKDSSALTANVDQTDFQDSQA
jgi:hypothetical protein